MPHPKSKYLTSLPVFAEDPSAPAPRTVVCFGTARGGTSMVAGAILGLGVPMGEGIGRNLEDPAFNLDWHKGTAAEFTAHARQIIETRNAAHPVWGWKFPNAARYLESLVADLRAPHLVCVYRDPVPMALRARPSMKEAASVVAKRLRAQVRNTAMIEALGVPCLMVSYEKAAAHPIVFIEELAGFLNLPVPAHVDEIVEFMTPGTYKDPDQLLSRLAP
ncbi:hypothetical protein A8B78_10705 [Jannaschia sp. EhC01]|nr:hypothetical protein A8B78_10705 [Jannaschia sp. EhC01]